MVQYTCWEDTVERKCVFRVWAGSVVAINSRYRLLASFHLRRSNRARSRCEAHSEPSCGIHGRHGWVLGGLLSRSLPTWCGVDWQDVPDRSVSLDEFSVEVGTDDSFVFGFGSEPYTYPFLANADVIRATLQPLLDYSFMKRDPSRVRSFSDGRRFLPPILKDTQPNQ